MWLRLSLADIGSGSRFQQQGQGARRHACAPNLVRMQSRSYGEWLLTLCTSPVSIPAGQRFYNLGSDSWKFRQCGNCRGGWGGSTPQFISSTPLVWFIRLSWGGQKITPPHIALVYTVCAIIALAQFLSRHLSKILYRYSIMIAVEIKNLWFLVNYNYVQVVCTLRSLDRSWKIYFLK